MTSGYRTALADYIRAQAKPVDKYGHQPRLYALTREVGANLEYDDDVVYAAAWLHDLGVFVGHRPEAIAELEVWDHVAYVLTQTPGLLQSFGFPSAKVPAVLDVIRTHQPKDDPATLEGTILRDADILEQLGAIGILRMVAKVGRDTRYTTFTHAVDALRRALARLPGQIRLDTTRQLAAPKILALENFLHAIDTESRDALY